MLVLRFEAAGSRYALDAGHVVEVVPLVRVQPVARMPAWVTGFFSYRGMVTPIIDLGLLGRAAACQPRFNTRVILLRLPGSETTTLGLLAERVSTTHLDEDTCTEKGERSSWGTLLLDQVGVYQLLDITRLVEASGHRTIALASPAEG